MTDDLERQQIIDAGRGHLLGVDGPPEDRRRAPRRRRRTAFKGWTAYEAQAGRVCLRLPYRRFGGLRRARVYLAPREEE